MDLRQLRYFVGIVQAGSLSRAADQLHVAQSAISHHLAGLEAELNKQLVIRSPKGVALTEAGAVLYRHAEAILRHVETAKQDAMRALTVPSGNVSVGFPTALSAILGHELFIRVRESFPQVRLHLLDGNSSLLRELLDNGRLDIAVLFSGRPERGLSVEPLLIEKLFFVTADPASGPITLAEAARHPLLLPGLSSGIQRVANEAFRQRGLEVEILGEIDTVYTLKRAVASGVANTILPWSALYDENTDSPLHHRPFLDAQLERPVALCISEVSRRGPAIDAVAVTLKAMIRDLVETGRWQGTAPISPAAQEGPSLLPTPP